MEKFSNLPKSVKGGIAVGGSGGLLLTGLLMGTGKWLFLGVLVLLLALFLGGYLLWKMWQRKKQAARMSGELQQHSSASPRAIADPGARARLDDLRKKFEQGVSEYKSRGKDLYTLPWYVIVGEPGSGKTEAIRHSNVGFPPGMQDEFQGVGGTINMNWWFTNHAVLLDTAGRLMFEEVKPGEQSEWREFLTLLKKNRPNCPINGLFLVIPSDSLIKDSADDIARKAGKIAQQLDVIQRVLDVRFPVYVVVTKCDKINGFREFFDGLTDPQLQHQMMGWSNPDQLDTPFRPDLVDQHLEKVAQRLRRRRMGSLRDPVPENQSARRADEVDSLYALPHSLQLLGPRLRRYLETIFVAGEWSAKPLFLRGIYFTSSMREGAALDEELAKAIGVGVEDLGEQKVWERERAYFLRDLFLEKVFREKGLVTRATNTARMLRSRQIAVYGAGSAALALFVLLAWFGMKTLRSGVKDQSDYWLAVSAGGWQNKTWKQSIVPLEAGGYANRVTNSVTVGGKQIPLPEFHAKLHDLAGKPLKRNFLFPGLSGKYQRESRRAQRIVFENGVIKPLLDASRQKMARDLDSEAQKRLPDTLAALIELEADILARGKGGARSPLTTSDADRFLGRLMGFVTGQDVAPEAKLVSTMVATYASDDADEGWPSPWLTGSIGTTNRLANNPGVSAGLEKLKQFASTTIGQRIQSWNETSALREGLRKFQETENALYSAAQNGDAVKFLADLKTLGTIKTNIDQQIEKTSGSVYFQAGLSLTNAYTQFQSLISSNSSGALAKIRQAADKALKTQTNQFFTEINRKLVEVQAEMEKSLKDVAKSEDPEKLKELDELLLAKNAFSDRWGIYGKALQAATTTAYSTMAFGVEGEPLTRQLREHAAQRERAAAYAGPVKPKLQVVANFAWDQADRAQRDGFLATYLQLAEGKLRQHVGFPLANNPNKAMTLETLKALDADLDYIVKDMSAPLLQPLFKDKNATSLQERIRRYAEISNALLDDNGKPLNCTISLQKIDGSGKARDAWRDYWRRIRLVQGADKSEKATNTNSPDDESMGLVALNQKIGFHLATSDESKTLLVPPYGDWSVLAMLFQKYNDAPAKRNGKTWLVELPIKQDGASGAIALKIDFDRPLPDINEWPTSF